MPGTPPGWHTLPVRVATDGRTLLILGDPPDDDPECLRHHCDSMGCGTSHVLVAVPLDEPARLGLLHLIDAAVIETVLPAPKLSMREQMIRRKGLAPLHRLDGLPWDE